MAQQRRYRDPSDFKRRVNRIEAKIVLWVVCEGKKTEPNYIDDFAHEYGNGKVKIEKIPEAGAPLTLVRKAVDLQNELTRKARRKSADSFEKAFHVWAVFDRDAHANFTEAVELAKVRKVSFCVSNPCFELWGLLHIENQDAEIHRHALQSKLKCLMPGYDHRKGAVFDYGSMQGKYFEAKKRAKEINGRRHAEDNRGGNPSTYIYRLLDVIIANGKK